MINWNKITKEDLDLCMTCVWETKKFPFLSVNPFRLSQSLLIAHSQLGLNFDRLLEADSQGLVTELMLIDDCVDRETGLISEHYGSEYVLSSKRSLTG